MTGRAPGSKFAVFAAVCVLAAVYVVQVTGNVHRLPFVSPVDRYEAELADASGLDVGADVRLAGVRVGRVNRVDVQRGVAVVSFEVDPDVEIADTWEVGARWRNVIGGRYLYLYDVGDGAPLEPGGRLPVSQSRPTADIGRFVNRLTPLLRAIDPEQQNTLIRALNEGIAGSEQRVQQLVRELASLSDALAAKEPEIQTVLTEGSELLEAYEARDAQLRELVDQLADAGDTLATRNDELIGAVSDIGEAQQRLGDLLRANHGEIRGIVDDLDVITDHIGAQREAGTFEEALANTRAGLATYMLISRSGQWFDVRAVAVQAQDGDGGVLLCRTEGNAGCEEPNSRRAADTDGADGQSTSRVPSRGSALDAAVSHALPETGAGF